MVKAHPFRPTPFRTQPPTASFAQRGAEVSEVTKTTFLPLVCDTPPPVWEPLPFPDVGALQG